MLAFAAGPFILRVWEWKKDLVPTVLRHHTSVLKWCCECRVCWAMIPAKHSTASFSPVGPREDQPGRLSFLLLALFVKDNGLLSYNCRNCQVVDQKKAAKTSWGGSRKLQVQGHKCTKDTTGARASPYTRKVQPPTKRLRTLVQALPSQNKDEPLALIHIRTWYQRWDSTYNNKYIYMYS